MSGARLPIDDPAATVEAVRPAAGPEVEAGLQFDQSVLNMLAAGNPLLGPATPLLTLVCQLRGTLRHEDVPRLHLLVSEELRFFESRALMAQATAQDVVAARYVLCSLVDETVLSTPWGANSVWSRQTMLSLFHKETWGGEKVFVILDRIRTKPARYLHLLELVDMCLTLGFRGRYEVLDNGLYQLEELRSELWRTIRRQHPDAIRPLSPPPAVERRQNRLVRYVPLWVVCCVAAVAAIALFGSLRYALNQDVGTTVAVLDEPLAPRSTLPASP